jgi:hypothetical protein
MDVLDVIILGRATGQNEVEKVMVGTGGATRGGTNKRPKILTRTHYMN